MVLIVCPEIPYILYMHSLISDSQKRNQIGWLPLSGGVSEEWVAQSIKQIAKGRITTK